MSEADDPKFDHKEWLRHHGLDPEEVDSDVLDMMRSKSIEELDAMVEEKAGKVLYRGQWMTRDEVRSLRQQIERLEESGMEWDSVDLPDDHKEANERIGDDPATWIADEREYTNTKSEE